MRRDGGPDRRRRPRIDRGLEHGARGARGAHGARDDEGLSRRARDAPPAHSRALRHPVPDAARLSSRAGCDTRSTSGPGHAGRRGRSSTRSRRARSRSRSGRTTCEAVAIALLHSYADDAHERRVEEIVRETRRRGGLRDPLVGDPSRDPRVRAHEHGRRQRLRRAGDHALHRLARRSAARRRASTRSSR